MKKHITTDAIHSGEHPEWFNNAVISDIALSTSYVIPNAAALKNEHYKGYTYTRTQNPTRKSLQEKLASIDGAEAAIATSSGMAAITIALMSILRPGDLIVSQDSIYGGSFDLFKRFLPNYGIKTLLVPKEQLYDLSWAPFEAKIVYIETPSNPTLRLTDIEKVVQSAHAKGLKVIADNSFATCFLQKPLDFGVDLVVYSATKFLNGHSDVLAGVVTGNEELIAKADDLMIAFGCPLDVFSCYQLSRGLKTLAIRMTRAQSNAMEISRFLAHSPKVTKVFYPGLWDSPERDLALKQMSGFGAMVSFEIRGGVDGASAFFDAVKLIIRAGSLGGIESTLSIPIFMSHQHLDEESLKVAEITPGMLRLSVGIEENFDLIGDLKQALESVP